MLNVELFIVAVPFAAMLFPIVFGHLFPRFFIRMAGLKKWLRLVVGLTLATALVLALFPNQIGPAVSRQTLEIVATILFAVFFFALSLIWSSEHLFIEAVQEGRNLEALEFAIAGNPVLALHVGSDDSEVFPLHHAVETGNDSLFQALLKNISKPDGFNRQGKTPLHLAIDRKALTFIRPLLEKNADPRLPDGSGKSALDMARETNDQNLLDLLTLRPTTSTLQGADSRSKRSADA